LQSICFQKITSGQTIAFLGGERCNDTDGTLRVTCKIEREAIGKGCLILRVSGQITGEHVDTFKTLLEQETGPLTLDLKDVRLVDGEAIKLLTIRESNGTRIINCPRYIREWIRRERDKT
jgi:hypothetical protein